jgi:hypothetical protein
VANRPDAEVLEIAVEEQRRVYDWLAGSYQQLRVKIITFLGGGLAVLTYLYTDIGPGRLFIPQEGYGKIFYFSGLALIVVSLAGLLIALKPTHWEFPIELKDLENIKEKDRREYLDYVNKRYLLCYNLNIVPYELKHKIFNGCFYPLVFGTIILVVLKIFGEYLS